MYLYRCTRFVLISCRMKKFAILFSEIVKNLNIEHTKIIWKQNVKTFSKNIGVEKTN